MTTDFPSPAVLRQFRLEAETGPTVLLFAGDARRLLSLLDAQRAALEWMAERCQVCGGCGNQWWRTDPEPCPVCGEARKLLDAGKGGE